MKLNEIELKDRGSVLRGSKMNVSTHKKFTESRFYS
jgi:hypothetical protein